jgi:hypothetical protein
MATDKADSHNREVRVRDIDHSRWIEEFRGPLIKIEGWLMFENLTHEVMI